MTLLDEIVTYAKDCISGKEISCQKHKWACQRLLRDIERMDDVRFPYVWNEQQAQNIVEWFSLLRHSKGVLAGQPIRLTPWQKFRLCQLYGWVRKDNGRRRYNISFTDVAMNNSKSQDQPGVALYEISVTATKNEETAEGYTAGTKREQSKIVFNEAGLMLRGSPLQTAFRVTRDSIKHTLSGSTLKPLSKEDGKTGDGTNPALLILDRRTCRG